MIKEFSFQWHITDLCDLRCRHCYQSHFTRGSDLSLETNLKILARIVSGLKKDGYSALSINLTGGEPLLIDDTYKILSAIYENPELSMIQEVNIISNGLSVEKLLPFFKNPLLKYLKISLEGPDAFSNDTLRGKGVFARVGENLQKLPREKVVIMFTLNGFNFKYLEEMIAFARKLKVRGLMIERFIPLENGKSMKELVLSPSKWQDCFRTIFPEYGAESVSSTTFKAYWLDFLEDKSFGALCNIGDDSMCLMPDGMVYPCRRLPIPLGNLVSDDFSVILGKLSAFRKQLEAKEGITNQNECIPCEALCLALQEEKPNQL